MSGADVFTSCVLLSGLALRHHGMPSSLITAFVRKSVFVESGL